MSDLEHESILDTQALHEDFAHVTEIAARALLAAMDAQELAIGHHERWMDGALRDLEQTAAKRGSIAA
jgi:hypothetical protein